MTKKKKKATEVTLAELQRQLAEAGREYGYNTLKKACQKGRIPFRVDPITGRKFVILEDVLAMLEVK